MELLSTEAPKKSAGNGLIYCEVKESDTYFNKKVRKEGERTVAEGQFTLLLDIIALQETVHIPISLASGKKTTGFVYQIEGTAEGKIVTTNISCKGEGISQVTFGTLLYAKIPRGKTARFRMVVNIQGGPGKEYKIVINKINFKLNPSDARYKKFDAAIETKTLKLR